MTIDRTPSDPDEQTPPTDQDDKAPSPFDRPPFDRDPEAQHAPGEDDQDPDSPGSPPPMQALGD